VLNVEALLSKQAEILQSELATLKSVLQRKAEDLERIEKTSSKDIRDLQARNQDLANKLTEIKEEHDRTKSKSSNVFIVAI
jgi:sugar-specific transcriptional regulator TrmB